jgi:hypothetical protein
MSLEEYESLDLTRRSDTAKDLFDRISGEGSQSTIVLTSIYSADSTPALLTQEMSAWFHSFILPYRSGAIEEVHDEFKRRNLKLFEQEVDKIEQKKLAEIASERAYLRQNKKVEFLRTRFAELSGQYDTLQLNYGREALVWQPLWYGPYYLALCCQSFS